MLKLAVRGLAARKLRALSTTFAVFLGVALMAGTYVLTDTINASFDDIFKESLKGTDVVVSPTQPVRQDNGQPPAFSAALLARTREVDGVKDAAGAIFSQGGFFDAKGKKIGNQFAPKFISSHQPKSFETLTYTTGHPPASASEVALDSATASKGKVKIGDTLEVAGERRAKRYRVVGLAKLGNTSFGGTGIAQLTLPEAQRITDKRGKFDQLSVAADDGVSPEALRDRIRRALPGTVRVETGSQNASRQSKEIANDLSFLKIALLVFSGVALFVGAFTIFNTFSITIAQRLREFGMLRTLGASRRQILRAVILESMLIGGLGSVLGLGGGILFAPAINALFKATGIDLPNTGTVIEARTIVVALIIGLLVTLVSSIVPAVRATRVSPMAALQEAELPEARGRGRLTAGLTAVLALGGLALVCVGLFAGIDSSGSAAGLMGAGAVMVLLGVSLISPKLVRPLASVAGAPLERLRGITGRLARENALRKPGRTATTAAALMIGLALVTFVTVFAAGLSGSVADAVDRNFQGDLVVQNSDGFSPLPTRAADVARKTEGVARVSTLRSSQARVGSRKGDKERFTAVDPRTANDVLKLDFKQGSPATLRGLGPRDTVLDEGYARQHHLGVGDRIGVLTQTGKRVSLTVKGTVKDNADLLGTAVVTHATLARRFDESRDTLDFVKVAPGADADKVQDRLKSELKSAFPTADVLNQKELKKRQEQQISQLVGLIYALLSLAVIVSLFGIANTLALSIYERTRELGMLRAIGMSRRQVRRVIRYEAVITAVIGAVLGLVLGMIFAALISRPLADEGFSLTFPVGTLLTILVIAALAGVLVAIGPARRAAKLDVLEALAYE